MQDIPQRPSAPIVLRFFGCGEEMLGVNGDYFTVGDTGEEDYALPDAVRAPSTYKLRFSRAAEGWRLTAADEQPYYLNQQCVSGLSPLRSGDVIRLAPGAAGIQFAIVHQHAESLAKLTARFAPRLLRGESEASPAAAEPSGDGANAAVASAESSPAATTPPMPGADAGVRASSSRGTLAFALSMLALGLLVGWLLSGEWRSALPMATPTEATADGANGPSDPPANP